MLLFLQKIVEQLIENSATFAVKTDFAQQKYIKKKKQKYGSLFFWLWFCDHE